MIYKYTKNEEKYLKHKIMKQTTKMQVKAYFQRDDLVEIKLTIKTFLAEELGINVKRLEELDKEYKEYYARLYVKMEDSFKSKYRLFIFSIYLKHERVAHSNTKNNICL